MKWLSALIPGPKIIKKLDPKLYSLHFAIPKKISVEATGIL